MTTDTQLELPIADLVVPEYAAELTIQQRFDAFHEANPWVFTTLVILTRDWLAHGHQRVGMKMLLERIRWEHGRATTGDQGFRVNNDFTSRYARLLVETHPEWAAAFETRALRAA